MPLLGLNCQLTSILQIKLIDASEVWQRLQNVR